MGLFRKKKSMKFNVVIAGLDNPAALDDLQSYLKQSNNIQIGEFFRCSNMDSLISTLQSHEIDFVFCLEVFKDGARVGRGTIKRWKKDYPLMRTVLIISNEMRGKSKLQRLYEEGYYDALYQGDASASTIENIIASPSRTKEEAYDYYNLQALEDTETSPRVYSGLNTTVETDSTPNAPVAPTPSEPTVRVRDVSYQSNDYAQQYAGGPSAPMAPMTPMRSVQAQPQIPAPQQPYVAVQQPAPQPVFENQNLHMPAGSAPMMAPPAAPASSGLYSVMCQASCVINETAIILSTAPGTANFTPYGGKRVILTFID